jgi:hypothetical protein
LPVKTIGSIKKPSSVPTIWLRDETVRELIAEARSAIFVAQRSHGPVVEVPGPEPKFKVFADEMNRDEIIQTSLSLARYMHEKAIPTLLLVDSRARGAYLPFIHAWRRMYPNDARPEIYFVSPSEKIDDTDCNATFPTAILSEFLSGHRHLASRRDRPVLVYDTCMHRGATMKRVTKLLESAGFDKVLVGVVSDSCYRDSTGIKPAFVATENPFSSCVPFGHSNASMVLRNFSILSKLTRIREHFETGVTARKEMSTMLKEAEI